MKVLFLTIGNRDVASSRARVYSYLPYLYREGLRVLVLSYTPSWQCRKILAMKKQGIIEKILSKLYSALILLFLFISSLFFDAVYIQKVELSRFTVAILRAINKKIIFDFDDAIFLYKDIKYLLSNAAGVVVSNKYLKEYADKHNRKVYELISPVEVSSRYLQKNGDTVTLGWLGSADTSRYLSLLMPVLQELKRNFKNLDIEFMGIDKNKYSDIFSGIKLTDWSIEEVERYLGRVNIGLMPLLDDEWSRGKAGYKLLQYMGMGIPCVASPVGINKEIIKEGVNGFLADRPEDWLAKLSLLVADAALRQRLGQEGLKLARKAYSYDTNAPKLMEILKVTLSL